MPVHLFAPPRTATSCATLPHLPPPLSVASWGCTQGFGAITVTRGFDAPPFGQQTLPAPDLHHEGRAVDISTADESKLGSVAELAMNLGFDFVAYVEAGQLHLSVIPDLCQAGRTRETFLPRFCSRTLMDCVAPLRRGAATQSISALSMR